MPRPSASPALRVLRTLRTGSRMTLRRHKDFLALAALCRKSPATADYSPSGHSALPWLAANVHRHKGTVAALKQALGSFGVVIECQEWFETGEPAHTFILHTPISEDSRRHIESQLNPRNYKTIAKAIDAIKPVRSHYQFKAQADWHSDMAMGGSVYGVSIMLGQMQLTLTKEQAA